jgi:CBS-domain-containing membrane protein
MRRTVQDVMTREVVAVRGPTPFKELVRLLNQHRITAMPVLDTTGRLVVGVVSESDLALKEVAPLRQAHTPVFDTAQHHSDRAKAASLTAAELMTAPAVTVGPAELVAAAARRMYDRDVKRLPVVDHSGALVGIVTRADLLKGSSALMMSCASTSSTTSSAACCGCPPAASRSRSPTGSSASPAGSRAAARPWPWSS